MKMFMKMSNGDSQYTSALNRLGIYYDETFPALAKECYEKAYKKGSINGLYNYADLLAQLKYDYKDLLYCSKTQEIYKKNREKAYELFKKYTELQPNDADGQQSLAELEDTTEKKRDGYVKAFHLGNVFLFDWLIMYGFRHNKIEAQKIADIAYDKVINLKDSDEKIKISPAQINRLGLFFDGFFDILSKTNSNQDKAETLWKIASENDDTFGKLNLATFYIKKHEKLDESIQLFEVCVEKGVSRACEELGKIYSGMHYWCPKANKELADKYFKIGSELKDPSAYCCLKVAENTNETNKKSEYYLKCIDIYSKEIEEHRPKTLTIPFDVLNKWRIKIKNDIPDLKNKITELECRPPTEGGQEYQKAKERFSQNSNFI